MRSGYLLIETHSDFPDRVRLMIGSQPPHPEADHTQPRLRYAARFEDIDAALMHAHTALRRALIDINTHLYKTDPVTASAAADAIDLQHRRIYLDPELADDPNFEREFLRRKRRHKHADQFWNGVGIAAILLLFIKLLIGF